MTDAQKFAATLREMTDAQFRRFLELAANEIRIAEQRLNERGLTLGPST